MNAKLSVIVAVLFLISGCTKEDPYSSVEFQSTSNEFPVINGRIQYPHDYYKEKTDSLEFPGFYKVHILVDLSKKEGDTKDILLSGSYISYIAINTSYWDHESIFYVEPADCWADPDFEDLNEGAGGRYIYWYYNSSTVASEAITKFWVTLGKRNKTNYTCTDLRFAPYYHPADLNDGAGGDYIWANAQATGTGNKMQGLGVIMGTSSSIEPPSGWVKIDGDLNSGAGGYYIYFIVKWIS